jgi:hypothetical protein
MKRFLLSLVVLVAFGGVTFAEVPPAPEVTVESVDDSVTTALEVASQYAMNAATPVMTELGPRADGVMYAFQNSLSFLDTEGVDASELTLLFEEAEKNYQEGRVSFSKGLIYMELADVFVSEAKDAEGTVVYILRSKAAVCYYEAAFYLECSRTALDTVIALGVKGEAVTTEMELKLHPAEDKVAGRYHLRGRVNRFFSRSRSRRA